MSDAPAGPTYYHASTHPFVPGETVWPGFVVGKRSFKHGEVDNDDVCLSANLDDAQEWARIIGPAALSGDVHVYEVVPNGPAIQTESDEFRCESATIVRRVLTLPDPPFERFVSRWAHDFIPA